MAGLIVKNRLLVKQMRSLVNLSARAYGGGGHHDAHGLPLPLTKVDIGSREVVGFGANGELTYIDSAMCPFPAIRFKEDKGDIVGLRTKEQGDWKKLTREEKKALYRASFCQTLVETEAPTGEWKSITGICLMAFSLSLWGFLWMKYFVYGPLPDTITNEVKQKAQIDRMIALRVNPIEGLASTYDYEKGQWKK
jgi:cytochrome c oxidase subunit 4